MSFLLCTISLEVILYDFELKKIAKIVVCCVLKSFGKNLNVLGENKVGDKNNSDDRCLL